MAEKKSKHPMGYGLVEVLAALLILSIGMLALTRAIVFSFHTYRNSVLKFKLQQTLSFHQNQLVAKPFNDPSLQPGRYKITDRGAVVRWQVTDESSTLKSIHLSVELKKQQRRSFFYKSIFIMGVKNE